jgi:hypothetical protein
MPKSPRKPNSNLRRLKPASVANSRYEVVFDSQVWKKPSLDRVVTELRTLRDRSGEAFGDAYARMAGSFIDWFERLEDASAERKFHLRTNAKPAAASTQSKPSTRNASVRVS